MISAVRVSSTFAIKRSVDRWEAQKKWTHFMWRKSSSDVFKRSSFGLGSQKSMVYKNAIVESIKVQNILLCTCLGLNYAFTISLFQTQNTKHFA